MLVAQAQSVPLTHVKEMKLKHWTTLGLTKADRDQITSIYDNEELQMFINQTQGFTISQFKSNIRADTVQMLLKMGITLPDGVKATVMNYQGYLLTAATTAPTGLRGPSERVCRTCWC